MGNWSELRWFAAYGALRKLMVLGLTNFLLAEAAGSLLVLV